VHHELQRRSKQGDLDALEERLIGKLNELLASLDIRYSDKENTRKKIQMIEKNVSKIGS
jgi:hypothetical protein